MRRSLNISAVAVASAMILGACSSISEPGNASTSKNPGNTDGAGGSAASFSAGPTAGPVDLYGPPANAAEKGGTVTVASLTEPPSLDPYHQASDARIQYTTLMYQGLMYESASGKALPLLAQGVDISEDGLTYTFHLRSGVKFHTGGVMTSKDVKYSYDYIRDAKNGSPGAKDFQTIKDITTPDDSTAVFHLTRPNSAMLMTVTNKYGGVIPAGYFDNPEAANKLNTTSVGTGPYKLGELKKNSNLTLLKSPDYWGAGGPYIDKLVFQFMPTSAAIVVALKNSRVDMAVLPRMQDAEQLKDNKQIKVETFPSLNQKAFDLDSNYPPLTDVRVRQAIASAIDKNVIAEAAAPNQHVVLGTVPAAMQKTWGLPLNEVPFQKRDVEKSKSLLTEAGYSKGFDIDLTIINGYDWMNAAAVVVTQELADVGIRVTTKKVELGTWIKSFQADKMGFTMNDWGTQPDPSLLFYRHFHKRPGGADFRNWNNDKGSQLLDDGVATADMAKRVLIYKDFQKVLAQTVPTVMLYSPTYVVAMNTRVHNYVEHPTGWWFGLAQAYVSK